MPLGFAVGRLGGPSLRSATAVFWKAGTRASDGSQEISIANFTFPSTVRDVQNDFLFLGNGWIHKDDALSVDEALEYFSTKIQEHPEQAAYLEQSRPSVGRKEGITTKRSPTTRRPQSSTPTTPTTHNNLGTAKQEQGDHAEAIEHFTAH